MLGKKIRQIRVSAFAMIAMFFIATPSFALVTVGYDTGTTNETTALTGYATTGAMMDGMRVTAYFTGGGSETLSWADTGAVSGGVTGVDWALNESGDTFGGIWTLSGNVSIDRILIDAGWGDSVFDINTDGTPINTAGSARGWTFEATNNTDALYNISATYIDQVALTGDAPVGDLWRFLELDFTGGRSFLGNLTFIADTDNILFAGDINPVPEPSTLILLGSGLIGLIGFRRRMSS